MVCLVFAVDNRDSFESIKTEWLYRAKNLYNPQANYLLVGTKADVKQKRRQIRPEEARGLARWIGNGCRYIETSATRGLNLSNFSSYAVTQAIEASLRPPLPFSLGLYLRSLPKAVIFLISFFCFVLAGLLLFWNTKPQHAHEDAMR